MINNKLFLLSGLSGAGKTTIVYKLLAEMPNLKRLVTYVTRDPRPNETDGVDYHFIARADFEKRLAAGEFFEHSEHYGHLYGNSRADLEKIWADGKTAIIQLDPTGVITMKKIFPDAPTIFITADNLDNLKKRIRLRPMSDADFEKRWNAVEWELSEAKNYDYVITNEEGKVDEAVEKVKSIINAPTEPKVQIK